MAVIETWLRQDLKGLVTVRSLQGQVFSLDNGGNLIGVRVTEKGQPVELEGTVIGYCILSDGQTVNITGSGNAGIQNGNEAYIVLPQLAYSVPGQISIVIKITNGSTTTTLAACTGYVYKSRTSNEVVPPGTPIPDLSTLEEVIRRATAATDAANTAATGAEKVDASMTKEGDVITITVTDRDGNVMTETMTDTANDVSELKSAFEQLDANVITESAGPAPIVSVTDGADGMPMRKVEVAIEPVQDLHGYEYPWPAGGGKNLLPGTPVNATTKGCTFTYDNGLVTLNGTASSAGGRTTFKTANFSLKAGTYTFKPFNISGTADQVYLQNGTEIIWGISSGPTSRTFTLESDYDALNIGINVKEGTSYNYSALFGIFTDSEVTEWTPYSNICPISGWTGAKVTRTGKNLFGGEAMKNALLTIRNARDGSDADGGYVSFTASQTEGNRLFTSFKSDTQYTVIIRYKKNNTSLATNMRIIYTDGTQQSISTTDTYEEGKLFTAIETSQVGKTIARIISYFNSGTTSVYYDQCGLFEGVITEDQFEPYKGQTYEVTFPADPGTVYGGTLDAATGLLTVDVFEHELDEADSMSIVSSGESAFVRFTALSGGVHFPASKDTTMSDALNDSRIKCSHLNKKQISTSSVSVGWIVYHSGSNDYPYIQFRFPKSYEITTTDAMKEYISAQRDAETPITICYPLATPITYQLTPTEIKTLLGINNIWSDAGNVAITYPADTKTYIDNRINSTRKLIAGIETGFTASKLYAVGDMLIIGDDLYKVTAQIASGATITVGTNVTKTTVAEQLLALMNA